MYFMLRFERKLHGETKEFVLLCEASEKISAISDYADSDWDCKNEIQINSDLSSFPLNTELVDREKV
jgi:hypothetical protein